MSGNRESETGTRVGVDRREFLARAGGVAAMAVLPDGLIGRFPRPERLNRIGVQLYTIRSAMRENMERTIEQVARIGFKEVEFAGYFGRSARDVRALLDANGLTSPSSHNADMTAIRTRFSQVLDDSAVIGHKYVVCASLPRSDMTADGYKRVAAEFNKAGEAGASRGIKVAFHNHDGDHAPLGSTTGFDILLEECDPRYTSIQMDLFWTVKAGKDPLQYFAKFPGRFYSVHVKDMAAGGVMVDVGAGQLPFAKYFAQSKQAGMQHYFLEHDSPADPMASIAASYRYLASLDY